MSFQACSLFSLTPNTWIMESYLECWSFEIFIFCPKIQLWFPEKIVHFLGRWKTRENVVVLDFWAIDNFDFTRKIVKKNLGWKTRENVVIMNFWTKNGFFEQCADGDDEPVSYQCGQGSFRCCHDNAALISTWRCSRRKGLGLRGQAKGQTRLLRCRWAPLTNWILTSILKLMTRTLLHIWQRWWFPNDHSICAFASVCVHE